MTCPGCDGELENKGWYGCGTLPDRSSVTVCQGCYKDRKFQNTLDALTWEEGKAFKRQLKARGYAISRSARVNDLKDGVLGLVFGSLIAVGGTALAIGSRGMVIAWGPVLACGVWAIKSLAATGTAGYQMWSWRRKWRSIEGIRKRLAQAVPAGPTRTAP